MAQSSAFRGMADAMAAPSRLAPPRRSDLVSPHAMAPALATLSPANRMASSNNVIGKRDKGASTAEPAIKTARPQASVRAGSPARSLAKSRSSK